ncbi:aminotransferase class I/II-fold pyridoxal phosphate-dependent enzyme [Crossiella sp. SN42]|uniref:pyridoxal phosphate-dependent decarboxylase family protein n=1 Tax=Crossiella sp. SN42 TaxID=2944808 RepID=UPI00207C8759|nr:aminotransferase class I/II-fold pyridoxal phosphate-dependent enzyme [Crossiella sp. SN42]MCO1581027.1 aminotransferase class I/II-fold pyridoxal phosphate-dependent enzyme [Crossiella sp. SN42]
MDLRHWLGSAVDLVDNWAASFGPVAPHPANAVTDADFGRAFAEFGDRMRANYPFGHPRYAAQMVKPPHPAAVVGYLAAMLVNPNNHALDGGPATARMEREVIAALAGMFGLPVHLGHLTTSGTIANLEALFVARETRPGKLILHSAEAHYTHGRMCRLLGVPSEPVPADGLGRMDLVALERRLRRGDVGTVVLTPGTTGLGAVDPIHEVLALKEKYGVRIHVDAAYGGFFALLAGELGVPAEPFAAIRRCDSVTIDPHKHGLQPYGCGAVLFADPAVGRFYRHDSPYTYFTSDELHLGEISLECSRAGAAAAALWLTLKVLPLTRTGLGEVLAAGRRAALHWAELIEKSEELVLYQQPELDILTYFPRRDTLSEVDGASARALAEGMADEADPIYLSTLRVTAAELGRRHPGVRADAAAARVLRSVLLKPEAEPAIEALHRRVTQLVRQREDT